MKFYPLLPFTITALFACTLLTGCGNDLSVPKSSANTSTQNTTSQAALNPPSSTLQSPSEAETKSEKTSMWVTLAGMKCH